MSKFTKGISMLVLSVMILALLVMIVLGFMLGFGHPLPWILIAVLILIPIFHDKIVNKRFVQWNDSYSVGVEEIDNDHKKLLGLINKLQTAAHYSSDEAMIDSILNDLVDYTKYHFSKEEDMLKQSDYPHFNEHKLQHEEMIKKVSEFIEEYRIDDSRTIDDVTQYLKSWLINHINGSDQDYVPYVKKTVK